MIKAYFWVFNNLKQNNWVKFLIITEFAYNNAQNINSSYILLEFNYRYCLYIFFKKYINFYSRFYSTKKLAKKLKNLILIY